MEEVGEVNEEQVAVLEQKLAELKMSKGATNDPATLAKIEALEKQLSELKIHLADARAEPESKTKQWKASDMLKFLVHKNPSHFLERAFSGSDVLRYADWGLDVNCDMGGISPLLNAISKGEYLEKIKALVEVGADPYATVDHKNALHLAKSDKVMEYLLSLEPKIDVNARDNFGETPFMRQVFTYHSYERAVMLVKAGAAVEEPPRSQSTILDAVPRLFETLVHMGLLEANTVDKYGRNILHYCDPRCVETWIELGVPADLADKDGITPANTDNQKLVALFKCGALKITNAEEAGEVLSGLRKGRHRSWIDLFNLLEHEVKMEEYQQKKQHEEANKTNKKQRMSETQ